MRDAFAAVLSELAAADPRIVLLAGDIGNELFDRFKERAPGRFFNCGVAEQNMATMAAGMALCGLRPVTYTIASFATTRAIEQIRVDICYHNAPVIIVGTGSGLSYASLGPTHHSLEDMAMLRAMPGMTVICPADAHEVRGALSAALKLDGPAYLRIGKRGEPSVHQQPPDFEIGRAIVIRPGRDACLIGTGNMVATALDAAQALDSLGLSTEVVSMHTVKPLDGALLADAFARFPVVGVIEEHGPGGLGSAVAEWITGQPSYPEGRLVVCGTGDRFFSQGGSQNFARACFGLTPANVATALREAISRRLCGSCKELAPEG